jgi:hypothetical protein
MSNHLLSALVIRLGLVHPETIKETKSWGIFYDLDTDKTVKIDDPNQIAAIIQEAIESEDIVVSKLSDFDIVSRYLKTQVNGKLSLVVPGSDGLPSEATGASEQQLAKFNVIFGRTISGEYIIPYRAESITELLLHPDSSLEYEENGEGAKVHFKDVTDIYHGDTKIFLVCRGEEFRSVKESDR